MKNLTSAQKRIIQHYGLDADDFYRVLDGEWAINGFVLSQLRETPGG